MLLKQIIYFLSVVDNNSFTEAAEACFISQSAISQQIKALEVELGVTLLIRQNRKFTVTPAGKYFYQQAKHITQELEQIKIKTAHIAQNIEQHLKIGYLHCYGSKQLSEAINQFTTIHPDVTLDLVTGTHESLYKLLRTGQVDVVLNDQRRALSPAYVNYHLITSKCFIEISPRNELSHSKELTLEDLQKSTCILLASPEQQEQEIDYYHNTFGLGANFLFATSPDEGRLMVIGNRGYMLAESLSSNHATDNNTKFLPLYRDKKQITTRYYAFWQKNSTNYLIEEFASLLHKIFSKNK